MIDDNINNAPPPGDKDANDLGEGQDGQQDIAERGKGRDYQARIDELTGDIYKLRGELDETKKKLTVPPLPPARTIAPNQQQAVEYLKGLDFPQNKDVKDQITAEMSAIQDRMTLNNEHMRLRGEYDGQDGRPRYDQMKVENYMREHAVYDPEVAYKALNEPELLDYAIKQSQTKAKQRPYVERGGTSGRSAVEDQAITAEKIEEKMKTPEGRQWYEQNRLKILDMMTKGQL